ncbi:immunoglobulin kappa light chain-like isoform X1 [Salminus brasiliensis]|uniref:immunoglobulin kappa light chain-like isoform X1 n=1 Tax=Salminus brasiliensis TaxID=930266 RepID=UPI003B82FE9B
MFLMNVFILTFLVCIKEYAAEATVDQAPSFALVEVGQTVVLSCKTGNHIGRRSDGDCKSCLAWYYQRAGNTPKVLIHSISTLHSDTPSRFVGSGVDHGTEFTLTISGVQSEDAGDYYCQSYHWINSRGVYTFGGGTRLEVGLITPPKLTVLPSSSQEMTMQSKALIMCLANQGFPSDWTLSWKVEGRRRSQETSSGVLQQDGLYSWSSTLTLTQQEWENGVLVLCEATRSGQSAVTGEVRREQCTE